MKNDVHVRAIDSRRTVIVMDDWRAVILQRKRESDNSWHAKTRVFGAVTTFAPDLDDKIYKNAFTNDASFTEEERAAHMSEYRKLKSAAIKQTKNALVKPLGVLRAYGLASIDSPVPAPRFSMHAGCTMCPCSPGFVLDLRWTLNGNPVDVWFERVTSSI